MTILPNKHNHPDKTLVYSSFLVLKKLKKERVITYSELLEYLKKNITSAEFLFLPTLNFLFILGLVNYKSKTDLIEYVEKS